MWRTVWRACACSACPTIYHIYVSKSIYQVRDYHNDPKAFARDVLRFEIALEGVKFLRSLEYAPPDAALTTSSVPTAIATTSVAVAAVPTPTLAAPVAVAPVTTATLYTAALTSASITSTASTVAPPTTVAAASVSTSAAAATAVISGGNNTRESIKALALCGLSTTPATSSDWVLPIHSYLLCSTASTQPAQSLTTT